MKRLLLLVLLSFALSVINLYADVILTDQEAETILTEIQESKNDLLILKTELTNVQEELKVVQNISEKQKTSFQEQLNEAEKEKVRWKTVAMTTSGIAGTLGIIVLALLF